MSIKDVYRSLDNLLKECPQRLLQKDDRFVIISDLHMGDGGVRDDLVHNRGLILKTLDYYYERGYTLILNGDIEDIQKFKYAQILGAWGSLFKIFNNFAQEQRFIKIVGNHDIALLHDTDYPYPLYHGISLYKGSDRLFVFHGHQASKLFNEYDYISEFIVKFMAKPFRIKNGNVAHHSRRRFAIEKRIYRYARDRKIIAIIGHTHRPLFESLSKYDSLRWSIEELIREYALADRDRREQIVGTLAVYKGELERLEKQKKKEKISRSLYHTSPLLVPCLFNSGCATGKKGLTCLELTAERISLVYWSITGTAKSYIQEEALRQEGVEDFQKYTLKEDELGHILLRLSLLGSES
ncbi:MAG: metallophosphoesterase [Treponemataceae bacterium]|nr:metallophosphoesterase [Treponemataceae bacterium]